MAAGHLFLLTLLLYTFQYIKAQGELKKPEIGVSEESYHNITIVCVLPESVRDGSSCNLYTGDQPQPYKEAQAIRMMWKSTIRILCSFNVIKNDLFRRLQERRDVSCDYGENTGSQTLSPRIDGYNFTFHKPVISTSRYEEDRIITCLIPGPAGNVTTCNLYVGEQSKPFLKTHIGKKKSQKANRWYCTFSVTEDDLIRRLWSVRSNEVSCDYRVSSGPNSLSPRSDGYSFTDLLISDPTTVTAGLTSPLTPSTAVNPTSGSPASSTLTTDTAKISTEGGQSSTESDVISNSQESVPGSTVASTLTPHISVRPTTSLTSPMTPSTAVNPTSGKSSTGSILTNFSGQAWQVAVGVVSGVGVFLVGLITCYLCRRTKKNHSQRPTVRQEDHSQYDLVMGAMSSAGKVDSGDSGIYSLITSVPSTFLPSCPVQVSAHEDEDSGNARIYSLITVPSTFIPSGPIEENGQSFENYTTDTYHVYSSIPDRLATSAQPDGLYSLLQAH